MELSKALKIANEIKSELQPYCDKIEIGGSVRREKPEVKDIEIVCIPKQVEPYALFRDVEIGINNPIKEFKAVCRKYVIVKGNPNGRYMKLQHPDIAIDLFMAFLDNWGWIYAVRIGSNLFNKNKLVSYLNRNYKAVKGFVYDKKTDKLMSLKTEKELFDLIGLKYIKPSQRS